MQLHELLHPGLAHRYTARHQLAPDARPAGRADLQYAALHRDRPQAAVLLDEGVLQIDPLAKYAVAFPKMSRSIFTRANAARNRLISICSALTGALLSAPVSLS